MDLCTHPQENYIKILFNDIELNERLYQLKFIENELSLVVSSIDELSKADASRLINSLKRIKEQRRLESDSRNKDNRQSELFE